MATTDFDAFAIYLAEVAENKWPTKELMMQWNLDPIDFRDLMVSAARQFVVRENGFSTDLMPFCKAIHLGFELGYHMRLFQERNENGSAA